jgi:tRNA G18 (ribose-2'-O)-methylase SpoU
LKPTNATRGLPHFVGEGEKLLDRVLRSRFPVISVLATDRIAGRIAPKLPEEVPLYVVPFGLVHELVGFPFHQGVMVCGRKEPWPSLGEIIAAKPDRATVVVCPKLSNPENLGAIARIGDVFGIDAIVTGTACPDPLSRRVLRVSMGSALRVPVILSDDLETLIDGLKSEHGVEVWAAVADRDAVPFESVERPKRLALVLGDENDGVDPAWVARSHRAITIPMRPGASSLNVSVAAGILLHHLCRE